MKNTKKKKLIIAFIVCLVVIGICLNTRRIWEKNAQVKELETEQISQKMQGLSTQTNETEDLKPLSAEELNNPIRVTALPTTYSAETKQTGKLTYLSDIPRMSKSTTRYGSILNDKTQNNAKITVKLGGTATSFDKGIWAHATSDLYYDLRNFQEYDYFSAYLGLNVTSNNGNGVTFIISTSNDGQNWTEKYRTQALPSQNATECRVPIKGYRYLRLYANDNGANGSDHSVYADAKLLTADYRDGTGVPTIYELDDQIKSMDESDQNLEYLVLQREFISRVGRTTLINFINEGEANKETLNWLMGDVDTLGLYFYGSTPIGGYKNSLNVLTRLYQTYKNDLNDTTVKNGIQNGYVFKKMVMALSHTHSRVVRSFLPSVGEDGYDLSSRTDPNNPQVSDPVRRYAVYKKMYLANKLSFAFPKLEVEEMKGVMKALISDNEIEWLRDYIASRGGYSANSSITYKFHYQFFNDKYYSEENKTFWNNRYHFLEYGIPYQKYLVPQWHVFAEGNLCVGISQTSANVYNSMGIPAHAVCQSNPAHEAYAIANYDINGNGSWQLCNSGTTWGNTRYQTTAEDMGSKRDGLRQNVYTIRAIFDWGQQYSTGCQNLSYITIAQEAVNNLEAYRKAEQYVMLANVYKGDIEKQEELYRKAIKEQNINIDAWYGLVQLYKNNNTYTEEDCLRLIKEFQPIFRTRILAFYDFTNMLIDKIKTPTLNAETVALRTNTLQWAEVNSNSIHRSVAKTLLDKPQSELATFSFDGKYAGQIRLGDMYDEENKAIWEYSIDGGKTWTQSEELYAQLTPTEILGINENNNILVHIIGTEIRTTIQIDKDLVMTNIYAYANDAEDAIYTYQNRNIEWRYSDDTSGAAAWKSYDKVKPNLSGNRSIVIRFPATGTRLPDSMVEFNFTDNKYPANETYIKTKNLSVVDSTTSGKNTPAKNMIDGNFGYWYNMLYKTEYSRWLSASGTDENKFITIELKEPVYLSRLDYLPSDEQDNSVSQKKPFNGRIMQGEVLGSMDGQNWTKLGDITNWANNISTKTVRFANPQKVKYVKVVATQTNDGYIGGIGFNLYEDTTKEAPPTATVKYSTTQKTNKDVVATLENFNSDTVVVDGESSHTFTENGAYTFNLRDTKTGRTNEIVASVEWIDRVAPTAGIQYIDVPNTKGYVQARIVNISKNVFILDEQDRPIRLIEKNGNYVYEYNFDPETKQVINMVQKDANNNIKWVRGYKLRDPSKPVTDIFENPNKNMEQIGFPKENPIGAPEDKEYMIYYFAGYTNGKITNQIVYDESLKNATSNYTADQIEELKTKYTTGVQDDVLKYVFTKNGEKTYKLRDRIGNTAEIQMKVDWINRGPYIAEISYDKEGATNENVTATLTFKEEGVKITNLNEGVIETENGGKYVFTENGDFRFKLIDSENVESYLDAKVTTIDKQVPQGIITYSTTNPTNQNVTASIEFDKTNVTITNNEGSNTHTFEDNGSFTFEFVDEAGNVGTAVATVSCIDRTTPIAQISYSTTSPTNQDVVANIVESNKDITITNNNGESVYTFTENGEFTFEFVDEAGNIGTATAKVDCIDKEEIVPTVSYRINAPTGKAETAIITFNKENVTVTNNSGKTTHRFEENGSFEFEFRDEAGNIGTATATVNWIDKEIPTAEVHYDRTIGTREPVTATLINPSKEITITNNGGKNTYTFTKNGKFIFEFEDIAGNPGEAMAEVTCIDTEAPKATITYSTTEDTIEPVIATLHLEDPNMGLMPNTQTHTFTKNGEYTFNFEDGLGNKGTAIATVNCIRSGALTADIKYEKTENGLQATLVNESRNITVTNNNGNRTYLLTEENNTFTFEYVDNFGNKGTTEAKYENMNGPATINYVFKTAWAMVNNKRTLVPKWTANLVLPTGYEMKKITAPKTYTFSEKGSYVFEYKNSTTNEEYKATATVDWFPEATVEYSTTELTKGTVDLIVHLNREGEELEIGNDQTVNLNEYYYPHPLTYYMKKKEGTINTYTFMHNVEFTLLLTYQGQRFLSIPVSVKNIDETLPVGTVKYSNTEPTYRNVTATIEFNKANVKILNNDGKDTFRFEQNGEFNFEYEDEVGHIGTSTAKVDWIIEDSDDVVPTIVYSEKEPTNKNVVATITFDQDDVTIVDEQGNELPNGNIYTFTQNGTHVFNYVDKKGKKGTATAEVLNIDKEAPVATISYSTTKKTNKPVTATISFNEENVTVEGGTTHTFEDSGSYTFNFIDQAGNRGTAVAEVNWIRKTLPNATITYDETELTCKDVTATISFDLEGVVILDDEGNIIPNGENYVFTENGTHIFRFRGPYGNEGSAVARVNYIDKVLPVPTISYDIENQTSGNVTATITFDKRNVVVEGGNTHVFKTNGEHTFNFMDEAGNKGWATAKVTWIDSDLPIATITYSPERPQGMAKVNTDVVATITFDQENVKIVNNGGSNQYTFEQNGEHEFIYEDAKGQRGTALAQVSWIDKEVPKATIKYSTTNPTNKDVTATITFDKQNVRITNNDGKNTYVFTENNEFEFEFIGPSGNKGKAKAKVDWIDKVAPTATITYNPESSTNGEVVATISFNEEDVTITNNDGNNTYTFTDNKEFTFEFQDKAGNTGSKTAKVDWIDTTALKATINYDINELTNKDVIATISFNKKNVTVKNGKTHIFTENGEYTFEYVDEAGNSGTKLAKVNWIDKKVPIGTIKYSTTNPTNQNVTATISFDKENVTITNNNGNNTYTFTENSDFTFEFVDKAGNTGTAKAHVDWIDRTLPVATITYDINTLTNHDVVATITFDKHNVEVEGGNTHTFTENGEYEFAFVGPAGNIGTAIAKVDWIDKKAPVATIKYSTTNPTNGEVTASITFDKENVIVEGGNVHTFTENDEYTFRYIDAAGNTGTKVAKVTWIDKTLPKATIKYSTTSLTNKDVTATISFDKENVTITNNNGSNTYTFTKNGKFEFEFTGSAGNRGTAIAQVNNIDKDAPVATISYNITTPTNKDVTATISFNEENVRITNNNGSNTYTFTGEETKEFTFEFVDEAGNVGSEVARVDWIKKTLPNATFEYSVNTLTNQDVTVTVTFDREGTRVTNNNGSNTYTFTKNGDFTFEFVGPYGNSGVATAHVDWIDKEIPIPKITYSTTEKTNQPVTATITFNKENVTVKGGNTHIFEDSGEYIFEFVDSAGNSGTATAKVDWLKKTLPNATISYSTTNPTNQDVIATITFDLEGVIVLGGNTHRFTENGIYVFEFVGPYGNRGVATAEVYWIDKVEPVATIHYSTINPTNGPVTATVTFDKENVRITNNDGKNSYTFTENGEFEFEYVGPAGNTGIAMATVDWIDKKLPKATITYNTTSPTNKDVTASITFDKENVRITNNNGSNTYTFTENSEFEFEFVGPSGNTGTALAKVTWIDKDAPVAEIHYSTKNLTNGSVIATISFNEEGVTVEGGNTHTFTDNDEYIFKYSDKAGNQGAKLAKVTWIDKVAPTAKVTYDITTKTDGNVVATLGSASEEITITNNNGKDTYTFTQNGTFTFEFVDKVGNKGTAKATVNWIKTDEDKYEEIKANAIKKIEDYQNKVSTDEIENKKINSEEKKEIIAAYDSLKDEDKAKYTEFINKIKAGGKPIITKTSTEPIKYKAGETINLYSLITIKDNEDGNIIPSKENVKITTNLNVQKAGTYDVTYEVTDLDGNKTNLTIQIVIEEKGEEPDEFEITSSKYDIKDNMILNVSQMTTVDKFKELITVNRTVHVVDKDGIEQTDEDIVATGMKITVDNEDKEYTIVVIGDIDGNGTRDIADLAKAKLHIIEEETLENEYLQAFDVDKDGEITINDIAVLKMSLIDLVDLD